MKNQALFPSKDKKIKMSSAAIFGSEKIRLDVSSESSAAKSSLIYIER